MTSPSANCAYVKIALLSSFFLLIVIHACISAFAWPNTDSPKLGAALEVQKPLKVLSHLQTAIFAPPFLGSYEFETVKYARYSMMSFLSF